LKNVYSKVKKTVRFEEQSTNKLGNRKGVESMDDFNKRCESKKTGSGDMTP